MSLLVMRDWKWSWSARNSWWGEIFRFSPAAYFQCLRPNSISVSHLASIRHRIWLAIFQAGYLPINNRRSSLQIWPAAWSCWVSVNTEHGMLLKQAAIFQSIIRDLHLRCFDLRLICSLVLLQAKYHSCLPLALSEHKAWNVVKKTPIFQRVISFIIQI